MSHSSATESETIQSQAKAASDSTATSQAGKTKVEKAHSYLTLIYTFICVLGALGAAFVWLTTTFFLGDVEIRPSQPVQGITIKVIDKHGQSATYFGKDVQLMPGNYHLEIGLIDRPVVQHSDVNVKLWKITCVPFTVPSGPAPGAGTSPDSAVGNSDGNSVDASIGDSPARKHWWQFWKKSQ